MHCTALVALVALAICGGALAQSSTISQSVLCTKTGVNGTLSCTLGDAKANAWSARATYDQVSLNTTGWARLAIEANARETDDAAAYATGYIDGALTVDLINLQWQNLRAEPLPKVAQFVVDNEAWALEMVAKLGPSDPYWYQVGLLYRQLDGITDGYNSHRGGYGELTRYQILYLGIYGTELGDVRSALYPETRVDIAAMTRDEFFRFVFDNTHCSSLVRVTADLSDMFASHNTWTRYNEAIRIFRSYKLPYASLDKTNIHQVSFSGYPGALCGIDDFYVTGNKLVVIETTNNVFNNTLYENINTRTLLYWVRVTIANRMATTAPEWHAVFYKYNSGTYNNQWITVDYKQFSPGRPLGPNTLWISEQIPGYFHAEDQTMALQRGHWPSYNVPFYEDIYNMSGYPEAVIAHGFDTSYQLAPRAKIFRRDAESVETLEDMQKVMRMNNYNSGDPLCPTPDAAIAARGDLMPENPTAGGAIDCKIVTSEMVQSMTVNLVSGPTYENQPVFTWTEQWENVSHFGVPAAFNFPWYNLTANWM